ncbi:MAG: hypothetical protein RR769_06010, partial [Anaerovoracaceae bacterium]
QLIDDASKYIKSSEEKIAVPITSFSIGDTVKHKVFGIGKVIEIKRDILSYVIKFDGSETERNLSFKAPLEKAGEIVLSSNDTDNKAEVESIEVQEIKNEEIQEPVREEITETPEILEIAQNEEVKIQEPIVNFERQKKRGIWDFFRKK